MIVGAVVTFSDAAELPAHNTKMTAPAGGVKLADVQVATEAEVCVATAGVDASTAIAIGQQVTGAPVSNVLFVNFTPSAPLNGTDTGPDPREQGPPA